MKLRVIMPLICLLFSIVTGINRAQTIDLSKRVFNLKGWNIPNISKMEKISAENVKIIEYLPKFLVETYRRIKYDKKKKYFSYTIPNKRILDGKRVDLKEDISTYRSDGVMRLKVYKTIDGQRILCYQFLYELSTLPYENLLHNLATRRLKSSEVMGGLLGAASDNYIVDLDGDGIYESSFGAFNNELLFEYILAFKYKKPGLQSAINADILKLKKAWIKYLDYPSQDNAKIVYELIPEAKKVNRRDESKEEKEFWNWVWLTLPVLEKEMSAGERYAVKIAFKLYPIQGGDFSPNIDFIISHFARVNPKMFLEEFKNHRQLITPGHVIDTSISIEKYGMANQRYLILKKTKDALHRVNVPSLLRVKDECIVYLEKQMKYLRDEFDVKK
jgi:hypothetical protein